MESNRRIVRSTSGRTETINCGTTSETNRDFCGSRVLASAMLGVLAKRTCRILASTNHYSLISRHASCWKHIEMGPTDPILGVMESFLADADSSKMNVSIGAYRDDDGKPFVLPVVSKAEHLMSEEKLNMEYSGIAGSPKLVKLATELIYGPESEPIKSNRVAGLQSLSGTGALRLACDFISKFLPASYSNVYCPIPTYANHLPILRHTNLTHKEYRYFDPETNGLDFEGMLSDLKTIPENSTVLLHSVAHNPTGVDPTEEQWKEISKVCKDKDHMILFDCAYQGFASGDTEKDAFSIRQFVEDGHHIILCQSFAKNFGVYGHRIGCLSVVCENTDEKERVESQIKIIARGMYSSPPIHGARIVETILSDPNLTAEWRAEVKEMADRIINMRQLLKSHLGKVGSELNWDHITKQIGMFCYTGLSPDQCKKMTDEWHVYLTANGRVSMAGINTKNVEYLAEAMHAVSK